jgi:MFS family permease
LFEHDLSENRFPPFRIVHLADYLAGALAEREPGARAGAVRALRGMMVLASFCCFACSVPVSFVWFFAWRFLAGVTGGVITVPAASTILPHTAPNPLDGP